MLCISQARRGFVAAFDVTNCSHRPLMEAYPLEYFDLQNLRAMRSEHKTGQPNRPPGDAGAQARRRAGAQALRSLRACQPSVSRQNGSPWSSTVLRALSMSNS